MEPRLSIYTTGQYGAYKLIDAIDNGVQVKIKPVEIKNIPNKMFCKVLWHYIGECNAMNCPRYPCKRG